MKSRWNRVVLLSVVMLVIALPSIMAVPIVTIRLNTRFAVAPASVRAVVLVEPHSANRTLRVQLDGEGMFSASDITLEGDGEKRVHEIYFKSVPAGRYSILAEVLTAHGVRGSAVESFDVISMEQ
jgi:hypothetical protein